MGERTATVSELDPIYHLLPEDQIERVLSQRDCDIDREFLGFTSIYAALASIIPKHWVVVDLGCAYAPQAFLFKDHKAYIGVDLPGNTGKERFSAPNTKHYEMSIAEFVEWHGWAFEQKTTFAICSYVPPWHNDNNAICRSFFKNVFTYYPASGTNTFPPKEEPSHD